LKEAMLRAPPARDFARCLFWMLLCLLAACSQRPSFNATDITGAEFGRDFSLPDHTGKRRTLADFRGKVVAIFFGYTQCPDVCPTTMVDLVQVRQKLGADGDRLQVLFVSVDPERDTPTVLAAYVPGFDPTFIGLRGTAEETEKAASEYKVFYRKVDGRTPTSYTVDHTAGIYVHDREGRLRLFVKYGTPVDAIVEDLRKL
jgi:protein SCO1/2